jgi:glucosamine--fructose-6-phosphate aminotransferase (isomerizing)
MNGWYIPFGTARAAQAEDLGLAVEGVSAAISGRARAGAFSLPGPVFTGIGASLAAACAPVWALRSRGIHSWRLTAGDHPLPFPSTRHPVIGISQSGRSAETLAVLESVPQAQRYAVVNKVPSPIADIASVVIGLGNLPDSYASTVGYTATVAALGILADAWDGGVIDPGWQDLARTFRLTEARLTAAVRGLASRFADCRSGDFVGAGPSLGTAEAAALLFREVARVPSTGMSTRQYLHGAMESAGDSVHVLFGDAREADVAVTLADAGYQVILVTTLEAPSRGSLATVRLPPGPPAQRAILEVLVMQILVEAVAEVRGVDIEEFVFQHSDTKVPAGAATAGLGPAGPSAVTVAADVTGATATLAPDPGPA